MVQNDTHRFDLTELGEPFMFYPQNHVGRGWGIRNGAMGAVRLPKILVLTIDDFMSSVKRYPIWEVFGVLL